MAPGNRFGNSQRAVNVANIKPSATMPAMG